MKHLQYTITGYRPRRLPRGEIAKRAATWIITAAMVAGFTVWAVNVALPGA